MQKDLFGEIHADPIERSRHYTPPKGYARRPGTGPAGETCGTCANCVRVRGGTRSYPKCLVVQHRWTGGPGSDVRVKSPACEFWKPRA